VSAVSVLGWQDLSQSSAPLATVASKLLGAKADLLLTLIALGSTANTVLLLLFASSRAMWAMSCAGALPAAFCVIGGKRHTPWLTVIIVGVIASIFALIRNIGDVAEFTNFATLLAFTGVNASAIRIFIKESSSGGLRHILTNVIMPTAGLIASLWLAINAGWRAAVFGIALLAAGIILHFFLRRIRIRSKGS